MHLAGDILTPSADDVLRFLTCDTFYTLRLQRRELCALVPRQTVRFASSVRESLHQNLFTPGLVQRWRLQKRVDGLVLRRLNPQSMARLRSGVAINNSKLSSLIYESCTLGTHLWGIVFWSVLCCLLSQCWQPYGYRCRGAMELGPTKCKTKISAQPLPKQSKFKYILALTTCQLSRTHETTRLLAPAMHCVSRLCIVHKAKTCTFIAQPVCSRICATMQPLLRRTSQCMSWCCCGKGLHSHNKHGNSQRSRDTVQEITVRRSCMTFTRLPLEGYL